MFFTSYFSSTGSCFRPGLDVPSGSCSGLPQRTLLSHPGLQRLQFPSIYGMGGYSLSLFPALQLARLVHSRWLAPLFLMGFHWHCDCSPGFTLTHSALALKLLFLAVLESGALLSSNLEEALYKST